MAATQPNTSTLSEETVITVTDLVIAYTTRSGDVSTVRDVSIDIKRGATLGRVGESGCGKSMLLLDNGAICEWEVAPWRDSGPEHCINCHIPVEQLAQFSSVTHSAPLEM